MENEETIKELFKELCTLIIAISTEDFKNRPYYRRFIVLCKCLFHRLGYEVELTEVDCIGLVDIKTKKVVEKFNFN